MFCLICEMFVDCQRVLGVLSDAVTAPSYDLTSLIALMTYCCLAKIQQDSPVRKAMSKVVGRLPTLPFLAGAGAMELVQRSLTVSAAGNAVMSGLVRACSTSTDSDAAWALYQDAHSYGYMLHVKAQQVLWKLQSGSNQLLVSFLALVHALLYPGILLPTSHPASPVNCGSYTLLAVADMLFLHHTVLCCYGVASPR